MTTSALRRQPGRRELPQSIHRRRAYHLMKRYGITPEKYDALAAKQNGVCAICGDPPTRSMGPNAPRLVVDHSHHTGEVRGLLCFDCNVRLAAVEDEWFRLSCLEYLNKTDGYVPLQMDDYL